MLMNIGVFLIGGSILNLVKINAHDGSYEITQR